MTGLWARKIGPSSHGRRRGERARFARPVLFVAPGEWRIGRILELLPGESLLQAADLYVE
jgi:hypothetical protein